MWWFIWLIAWSCVIPATTSMETMEFFRISLTTHFNLNALGNKLFMSFLISLVMLFHVSIKISLQNIPFHIASSHWRNPYAPMIWLFALVWTFALIPYVTNIFLAYFNRISWLLLWITFIGLWTSVYEQNDDTDFNNFTLVNPFSRGKTKGLPYLTPGLLTFYRYTSSNWIMIKISWRTRCAFLRGCLIKWRCRSLTLWNMAMDYFNLTFCA